VGFCCRSRPNSAIFQNSEIDGSVRGGHGLVEQQQAGAVAPRQQTVPGVRPALPHTTEEELVRDLVFVFQVRHKFILQTMFWSRRR
jgi:hypothetical protein